MQRNGWRLGGHRDATCFFPSIIAGRITTHMRNVTELPARMDARWDCVCRDFFPPRPRPRLPPAPPPASPAAAAGLIDEDWGAGFTSGAGRTPTWTFHSTSKLAFTF